MNLPVADGANAQMQPRVAPTPDRGVYVSWFEGTGFDVRIQKLDATGAETFPHAGILVADRGFSSTQDYDLAVDAAGNALLTFRDDRGTGTQITATLVTPAGAQPWGASGGVLTSTTDFIASPKITGTSDGGSVVAWLQGNAVRVQKLDGGRAGGGGRLRRPPAAARGHGQPAAGRRPLTGPHAVSAPAAAGGRPGHAPGCDAGGEAEAPPPAGSRLAGVDQVPE